MVIVISFDGLSTLDFDFIKEQPNFKEFIKNSSYCKKVYTIYPSLTYPAHATIVTGKYPKNHGVINNTLFQPKRKSPDWYWFRKYIKGSTIYDIAIDNNLKVAALLWPVTGKSRIQYNIPEIFANRPWQNQILVSLFSGSPLYQFTLNNKFGHLRSGLKQPELDNFLHESLLYTIREKRPDLVLAHYVDLDSQRHRFGFNSSQAQEALKRHDKRLGDIINNTRQYKDVSIIVLGDHSSLDENKLINLNVLFKERGLLSADRAGKIKNWQAICKNCDGSCYIYAKDNNDLNLVKKVKSILEEFVSENNGIEKIYESSEASALGADKNCIFMLEAQKDFYFGDAADGSIVTNINPSDLSNKSHLTAATHGYSPYKPGYTTVFFASGAHIKKGIEIKEMNLIDEGPTIAAILGFELDNADGKIIRDFFI